MEKYKQVFISLAILTYILSAGVTTAYARPGELRKAEESGQSEAILDTFEDGDYDEWKRIVSHKSDLANIIDKKQFTMFIEARNLARAGKYDEALDKSQKLGQELDKNTDLALKINQNSRLLKGINEINEKIDKVKQDIEKNV